MPVKTRPRTEKILPFLKHDTGEMEVSAGTHSYSAYVSIFVRKGLQLAIRMKLDYAKN